MPTNLRKGVKPALIGVMALAGVGYWIVTTPNARSIIVPFVDAIAIDAPVVDAATDSAIDAPEPTEWVCSGTLAANGVNVGAGTPALKGADGIDITDIGANRFLLTPWEGVGKVTVLKRAGTTSGAYTKLEFGTVGNVEDSKWGFIDGDAHEDFAASGQGKRIKPWFGPEPWTDTSEIDAATNLQMWMQLAITSHHSATFTCVAGTDVCTATAHGFYTGDLVRLTNAGGALPTGLAAATDYFVIAAAASGGSANTFKLASSLANANTGTPIDITADGTGTQTMAGGMRVWAGGRNSGGTAYVGYFYSGTPRTSSSWTFVQVVAVDWLMSALPSDVDGDRDLDLFITDRGPNQGNKGARLLRKDDGAATYTKIVVFNSNNDGDPKFGELVSSTKFCVGMSSSTKPNKVVCSTTTDSGATWTPSTLLDSTTYPTSTGQYQAIATCDIVGVLPNSAPDGVADYVLTHSSATGDLSGVVAVNGVTGARIEIDHGEGEKYDDLRCIDMDGDGVLDVVTTEQNIDTDPTVVGDEGLGVRVCINPAAAP